MSRYPSEEIARFDQQFAETPEERRERQFKRKVMTPAGTPSLNRPLPDRTEAEARIKLALNEVRETAHSLSRMETKEFPLAALQLTKLRLQRIIRILENGA